jgi:hypothetical protein
MTKVLVGAMSCASLLECEDVPRLVLNDSSVNLLDDDPKFAFAGENGMSV